MAKRENYEIKKDGVLVDTRHAWNASIRSIEKLVGEMAKSEGTVYRLVGASFIMNGFYHDRGSRTWEGANGRVVVFTINKV